MKSQFNVNLKVWYNMRVDDQDKSVSNIVPVIESLDPYVLTSLFQSAVESKSVALALKMIWRDGTQIAGGTPGLLLSLDQAVTIARVDEQH